MLILPFYKKIDWKQPPLITIFLVLVNCFVFIFIQADDAELSQKAVEHYVDSKLPQIEFPLYLDHMTQTNQSKYLLDFQKIIDTKEKKAYPYIYFTMAQDGTFMRKVNDRSLVDKEDPRYSNWVEQREEHQKLSDKVVWNSYGYKPGAPTPVTLFTHMFLHGGYDHLIGNMLFLFILGFVVESILGKKFFLAAYLVAGLGSSLLDVLVNSQSLTPSIGASGAIAGLMGMYTVFFGLRKINFFYFAFVYFDYAKAPAIILLPMWLGYELYQLAFIDSNVNYLAHIGGIISGAVIAFLFKRFTDYVNLDYMDESEKTESFTESLEKGMEHIGSMEYAKAKPVFLSLEKQQPQNQDVLSQLYNLSKNTDSGLDNIAYANKIFSLTSNEATVSNLILNTFQDHVQRNKNVRIPPTTLIKLAQRFIKMGNIKEGEMILAAMLRKKVPLENLPQAVLSLSYSFHKLQQMEKCRRYLTFLISNYSDKPEAKEAKLFLSRVG